MAIDLLFEGRERGIEVTSMLGKYLTANIQRCRGSKSGCYSPCGGGKVEGLVDFVFIDGGHTGDQVLSFDACRAVADPNCVYVFHDVINFR